MGVGPNQSLGEVKAPPGPPPPEPNRGGGGGGGCGELSKLIATFSWRCSFPGETMYTRIKTIVG